MIDFLKKKFKFAKGGFTHGTDMKVTVEQGEWIIPLKVMKRMIFLALLNGTENVRFVIKNAVAVTHCKDCKQWRRNNGITESPNGHCFNHDIDTNGHDFCSYGERKDNETTESL